MLAITVAYLTVSSNLSTLQKLKRKNLIYKLYFNRRQLSSLLISWKFSTFKMDMCYIQYFAKFSIMNYQYKKVL